MIRRLSAAIVICAFLATQTISAQTPAVALAQSGLPVGTGIYDPSIDAKVEALLRKMTLEEKIGQPSSTPRANPPAPAPDAPTTTR